MKLGEERITKEICVEQCCEECGESAKYKHTFLLNGARQDRASSAYGRDDCSWCSDEDKFACEEHKEKIRREAPNGMGWCSTFERIPRFEHMFLYRKKVSEELK